MTIEVHSPIYGKIRKLLHPDVYMSLTYIHSIVREEFAIRPAETQQLLDAMIFREQAEQNPRRPLTYKARKIGYDFS